MKKLHYSSKTRKRINDLFLTETGLSPNNSKSNAVNETEESAFTPEQERELNDLFNSADWNGLQEELNKL